MFLIGMSRLAVISLALILSSGQIQAQSPAGSVTVADIITLLEAKLPEQVVLAKIRSNSQPFNVTTDELLKLKKAGASEQVLLMMLNPSAPAASGTATTPPPSPSAPQQADNPFTEVGVYYSKAGKWTELLPEVVNWKTGGVLKSIGSAGIVKKDVNGHLPGPNSRNSVASPLEFTIYTPDGVAITEYQLIRLRSAPGKDYREFRTITGGVFNSKSGAMRDMVPFEGKKTGSRLYSVVLPNNMGAGEYGFIYMGASGGAGGMSSLAMGKMYTFRLLE